MENGAVHEHVRSLGTKCPKHPQTIQTIQTCYQQMEDCKTDGLTHDMCNALWWLEWPVVSAAKSLNLGQLQS